MDLAGWATAGPAGSGRFGGKHRRLKIALLTFGVFTASGLFYATELFVAFADMEPVRPLSYYLVWTLPTAWSWFCVFPIIVWCTRRWPFEKGRWKQSLAAHGAVYLLIVPIQASVDISLSVIGYSGFYFVDLYEMVAGLRNMFLSAVAGSPVPFAILAGLLHGGRYYLKYRERELTASRLENALNLAQLQALRTQLNPHFLFNTLNAIGALSRKDAEATNRMITLLCALLRRSLDSDGRQVVPLREEVDFVRDYMDIEKVRFPDRLSVAYEVPPDLLDSPVPSLVLQPLAENAVRHGIAPRSAAGLVTIKARTEGGALALVVEDDGVGLRGGETAGGGHGLRVTRERLQVLYGKNASLELVPRNGGGARATVRIPMGAFAEPLEMEDQP